MRAILATWLVSLAGVATQPSIDPIEVPMLSARVQVLLAMPPYAGGGLPRGIDREFRNHCTQRAAPFSVVGDFDADGREDLAFWWLASAPVPGEHVDARLLVHESRADRLVELMHLRSHATRLPPLDLHAAGSSIYDHHRSASLRLAHDTIASILCWKTSTAWLRRADGSCLESPASD